MQVFAPLLKSFWVGTLLLLQPFHFKFVSVLLYFIYGSISFASVYEQKFEGRRR
jgi:hypothetical protein